MYISCINLLPVNILTHQIIVLLLQDDMHVRCYNYNTLERVHQFEAHSDYIRSIAVHPTQPFFLTSSGKLMFRKY